jgi:hypothetical protein
MSTVNSFDKNLHFAELRKPLFKGSGTPMTPAQRKDEATSNLGIQLTNGQNMVFTQVAPAAATTSTTLSGSALLNGLITANQGAAGAATYTLPLGTTLETAWVALYPDLAVNDAFDFSIVNISTVAAEDVTVATNTGWTLFGNVTVASNATTADISSATFRVRRTAANTFALYRLS